MKKERVRDVLEAIGLLILVAVLAPVAWISGVRPRVKRTRTGRPYTYQDLD